MDLRAQARELRLMGAAQLLRSRLRRRPLSIGDEDFSAAPPETTPKGSINIYICFEPKTGRCCFFKPTPLKRGLCSRFICGYVVSFFEPTPQKGKHFVIEKTLCEFLGYGNQKGTNQETIPNFDKHAFG